MVAHSNQLGSLHDQLKEMESQIKDQELAMTLLASLPEEFKPLLTAMDAVGTGSLSFKKDKVMMIKDADRIIDATNFKMI